MANTYYQCVYLFLRYETDKDKDKDKELSAQTITLEPFVKLPSSDPIPIPSRFKAILGDNFEVTIYPNGDMYI